MTKQDLASIAMSARYIDTVAKEACEGKREERNAVLAIQDHVHAIEMDLRRIEERRRRETKELETFHVLREPNGERRYFARDGSWTFSLDHASTFQTRDAADIERGRLGLSSRVKIQRVRRTVTMETIE